MSSSRHSPWTKPQVTIVVQHMSDACAADSSGRTSRERDGAPNKSSNLSASVAGRTLVNAAVYVECVTNKFRNQERVAESSNSINYGLGD